MLFRSERGIGMAKDYMKILTTSSDLREKLFEAVEWDRRKYKDTRRRLSISEFYNKLFIF